MDQIGNQIDLRPLSIGEILDRTFTLYRRNFVLFAGIAGIPQLAVIAISVVLLIQSSTPGASLVTTGLLYVPYVAAMVVAYLFAQGGTVLAVSRIYLGRSTKIAESLAGARGELGALLGASILNGLAIMTGMIFLFFPGIYLMCRLLVFTPAVMLEQKSSYDSLNRSMELTRDHAGQSFLILLLYFVMLFAGQALVSLPFALLVASVGDDVAQLRGWLILMTFLNRVIEVLLTPVLLIATSVFYYDMRVRKEGYDLELMMERGDGVPTGAQPPPLPMS